MDRQRIQGSSRQTIGTTEQPPGTPSGDRDLANKGKGDKAAGHVPSDGDNAMDAVREVVEQDQARYHPGKDHQEGGDQQGRRAMEAVREIVRKEQN